MKRIIFSAILIIFFLVTFMSENKPSDNFIFPSKTHYVTSEYGFRDIFGSISFHDGTDFGAPFLSEVYASNSGVVSFASFLNGYGNTISITHDNGYVSSYSHLASEFKVKVRRLCLSRGFNRICWSKIS